MPSERRDWEKIEKFTPELYWQYTTAPFWEVDSIQFNNENDYIAYYCTLAKELMTYSKAYIGRWQQRGKQCARAVEMAQNPTTPIFDYSSALAYEPLPLAVSQIQEKVALLSNNPGRPEVQPQQEGQFQYTAALNQLIDMVLEANNYDIKYSKAVYDIRFWAASCWKLSVDPNKRGLFGDYGNICLEKLEWENIFPDPACEELHWDYMDYIIQKHTWEIGDIREKYPFASININVVDDEIISDTSVSARNNEDYIQSPQPKLARDNAAKRQKITGLELWLKDSRTHFVPLVKDENAKDFKDRFKLDKEGFIMGSWKKRYPSGRLIICTNSSVLKDVPNPNAHGEAPFIFPLGLPSSRPYCEGEANRMTIVTRKYNDIAANVHRYLQSEIPRPMHRDSGAILNPDIADQVPNDPSYIIDLAPGKHLDRRPAQDIPPSTAPYLGSLQNILDMTSGSSGIMRGNISDGQQLSAEGLSKLQDYASSRLVAETRSMNAAVKQLGRQLMWLLRQWVKEDITLTVKLPDGKDKQIDWKSDRKTFEKGDPTEIEALRKSEDYLVKIKAGTGDFGAKQGQQAQALELYREKAIDRQALLDALEYPNRQQIISRMTQQELDDIKSKAIGKELGAAIGAEVKQAAPGRRPKAK
jgi:hypothetical protein